MAIRTDAILDDDYDLDFEHGDFKVREADDQHVNLTLLSAPGEWKQHPAFGVGIHSYILSTDFEEIKHRLSKMLSADGYTLKSVDAENGELQIEFEQS